ncbi:sigma 54-interacting transcriptional regulator [Sorangium sp. So ce385]|uniref:sigma 54-interacting transcriptional regulator n=1 Tax=Sorangium sp. So ce385 TaxID=3133308 RepID=UPI003F5BD5AC
MRTTWFYSFASDDVLERSSMVQALLGAGIKAVPRGSGSGSAQAPGIVVFHELSEELLDFLQEQSRNGLTRVLAIALVRSSLSGGGAWTVLQHGASDVIVWEPSAAVAQQVAARIERWEIVDHAVGSSLVEKNLIGRSRAWTGALRRIVEIARFTDAPVLLEGESGTGKELTAQLIHALDPRPDKKDLVVLDCTTIVPELSGSEFFGHEKGAFTGAAGLREGAFALADGGTLFLDEIGELPLPLQAQLLRVVQERTYKRVGGNTWQRAHFRLVCATNRDVLAEVERGAFRRDLYYRIANVSVKLPPLRERTEDIIPLAQHFMRCMRPGVEPPPFDDEVRERLQQREYPGNVRDLRQLVTRIYYRHVGPGPITVGELPDEERPAGGAVCDWRAGALEQAIRRALTLGAGLKDIGRAAEDIAVRIAVDEEGGNLQRAAVRLGVTDRALQMRRAVGKAATLKVP